MSETNAATAVIERTEDEGNFNRPVIMGAAGDIGRTLVQQLTEEGVSPAGVVLTDHRLVSDESRFLTAEQIAHNFGPDLEERKLAEVELEPSTLRVNGMEIPVFTPSSQHEIFQEGHGVIDATGDNKKRELLEKILDKGAGFVTVTSPIHESEGIPAISYGVNGTEDNFRRAAEIRLLSDSSCTTMGGSSFLGPLREAGMIRGAMMNVIHARTNSDDFDVIDNNFMLSSSGAIKEIPKILGIGEDDPFVFDLQCTRGDVACGSLAVTTLLLDPRAGLNQENIRLRIENALSESSSVYEIDDTVKDTKSMVGRLSSTVLNLGEIRVQELPGGDLAAFGIHNFYDNVHAYTARAIDNHTKLSSMISGSSVVHTERSEVDGVASLS